MITVSTVAEAEAVLAGYVPLVKNVTGKDITIERVKPLMEVFGNPQERLKIVHIAGTSGKTSSSYYIATMLHKSDKRVGLTVSPHIDSVTERIQVDGLPLPEEAFVRAFNEYMSILEKSDIKPTYFELLVSLAYWYFDKIKVDYAVIETGLGGLHDATNIATNPDKLCLITDIGLDHMHILGNTVKEIARQKAGIIHAGNTVIMNDQPSEVVDIINQRCEEVKADLVMVQPSDDARFKPNNMSDFQYRNWSLAYQGYKHLQARDGLAELSSSVRSETMGVQIPARMDVVNIRGVSVVMDGAHNEQKMKAFVDSFKLHYPGKKAGVLIGLRQGKELAAVLPILKPITNKLITTSFDQSQDMPISAIDPHELGAVAKKFGFDDVVIEPDKNKAYDLFLRGSSDLGIITGSFYLISQLRHDDRELISG